MRGDREIVVVLAFKAVYTLEQGRRDNEKKIIALYAEMKDMMRVLLSYVHISPIILYYTYGFAASKMCKMTSSSHPAE